MTIARVAVALGLGITALAGGTAAVVAASYLLAQIGRRWGTDPNLRMGTTKLTQSDDLDAIRAEADRRRAFWAACDAVRTEAAAEAVEEPARGMKLVGRR